MIEWTKDGRKRYVCFSNDGIPVSEVRCISRLFTAPVWIGVVRNATGSSVALMKNNTVECFSQPGDAMRAVEYYLSILNQQD